MIKFVIRGSIRNKMRTRLASKSGQRDIAMMKVALEKAGITMNCSVRTFRDALQAEFPEYAIVLERGIQRCYKFLLDTDARTGKLLHIPMSFHLRDRELMEHDEQAIVKEWLCRMEAYGFRSVDNDKHDNRSNT